MSQVGLLIPLTSRKESPKRIPRSQVTQVTSQAAITVNKKKGGGDSYGGLVMKREDVVHIALDDGGLSSANVAHDEDLVQVLLDFTTLSLQRHKEEYKKVKIIDSR